MRLDKFLAHAGLGTRKEVKTLIRTKRVLVNQQIITDDGYVINENNDQISLDNQIIQYSCFHYLLLNKPAGFLSATEDLNCPTVIDLIGDYGKFNLFPVGRLDKDTTGLLLLTNNGKLAHHLLSPKHHIEKEYRAALNHPLTSELIQYFYAGVVLDDGYKCQPAKLIIEDLFHARIIIHEGKFHQIKRMFAAYDYSVTSLERLRMLDLTLDGLALGHYRLLTKEEIFRLLALLPY